MHFSRRYGAAKVLLIGLATLSVPIAVRADDALDDLLLGHPSRALPDGVAADKANRPPTPPAAGDDKRLQALVDQLGDPDPAVRERATQQLRAQGASAKRVLSKAAESPRPAIADAAQALLAELPWFEPGDPADAQRDLKDYGLLATPAREARLNQILSRAADDPAAASRYRRVVLRVLAQETAPEVAWAILPGTDPDASWADAVAAIDESGPSALLLFKARHVHGRGNADAALALLERVIERETAEPTTYLQNLQWAVQRLTDRDRAARRYTQAANRLRSLLNRPEGGIATPAESQLSALLLELQARHGPLPGWRSDLTRTAGAAQAPQQLNQAESAPRALLMGMAAEFEQQQTIANAAIAHRLGSSMGQLLLAPLTAELADEQPHARIARLGSVGGFMIRAGLHAQGIDILERAADVNDPNVSPIALQAAGEADLRLYDVYAQRRAYQKAGQRLERAIQRLPGHTLLAVRNNGKREAWPHEEIRATINWNYFKHAEQQKDEAAMREHANAVLQAGSSDTGIFLDVLPALEQSGTTPAEVDAYFERTYKAAKAQLDASPDDATYFNELAWLCARANRRLDEAVKLGEEAVKRKPEEAAYLDTLAEAKFRVGAVKEAIALEEKAIRLKPDDTFMHEQLDRFKKAAATQPTK